MTEQSAINEVRALLRAFAKTEVKAIRVVVEGMEIFLSRDASIRADQLGAAQVAGAEPAVDAALAELLAPHIGTIAALCAPGTTLSAGEAYGRISVLDEEIELVSDSGGVVTAHCRAVGELVEYGQPVVTIAA
jgi:biotin carboxyl carrier protein